MKGNSLGCTILLVPVLLVVYWVSENLGTILLVLGITVAVFVAVFVLVGISAGQGQSSSSATHRTFRPPPTYMASDGPSFERYVQDVLSRLGYSVKTTGGGSDYGVDLIAVGGGAKIAVQVKNHAKPVGVRAVQEVNTGKSYYRTDAAWVVARNGFTPQARALAGVVQVRLVDVKTLERQAT